MNQPIPDDQLDRVVRLFLDRQADAIEASATSSTAAVAGVRSRATVVGDRRLAWAAFLSALVLAALLAAWAAVGRQPSSPLGFAPGSIAFTREGGLFVAAPDGSEIVRLADAPRTCCLELGDFRFAPDRRHLAYLDPLAPDANESAERLDILDTGGAVVGSYLTAGDAQFAWAPDGTRLVVVSDTIYTAPDRATHLIADHAVIDVSGKAIGSISLPSDFILTSYFGRTAMAWSPDGRSIAVPGCLWPCDSKYDTRYLLVASDGTGSRWLTEDRTVDTALAWAPGSSRIALGVYRDHVDGVEILAGDGSLEHHVALPSMELLRIAWSPDGSRFVVGGATGGPDAIVLVEADGTSRILPASTIGIADTARWSADGQRFVFVVDRPDGGGSTADVWSIATDGSDERLLIPSVDQGVFDVVGQP